MGRPIEIVTPLHKATKRDYGWFVGGAMLFIVPLWLVLRIAERRARRRR